MTRARTLAVLGIAFLILILGVGTAAWWYLFGPNKIESAELVPGDTVFFASIPNAATIVTGYQTSQLKQLVDSPNAQPVVDSIQKTIGQKPLDVLNTFAPNLSGQSFFAITHFDSDHPEQIGLIAAMKPKAGMGNFDAFVAKLKESWPVILKQGTPGTGTIEGVDYQSLKGPGATDKICVAQVNGWIVTTWGEAPLQDWIERFHKKAITPSLAQNPDYQKSLARVGKDAMTLVYIDYHAVVDLLQKQLAKTNNPSGALLKKLAAVGGIAMTSHFENGEIVDHISCLIPKEAREEAGMAVEACPFETLKFTGPKTELYWATSVDWQQYWKNIESQAQMTPAPSPFASALVNSVKTLAQGNGLDLHKNIIDPLGPEMSLQLEWNDNTTYPELGFFVKIAKPDDFKPTIDALIAMARKMYATSAVINELKNNGQSFAELKFIQSSPVTITITETGPYFGIFTSDNLAVGSFARDDAHTLAASPDFSRQIGDKRNGASQIAFVDSPKLLDQGYKVAMPYLSLASMFSKDFAAFMQGKTLPNDLTWLAPMGTWSYTVTPDDQGIDGYSVSGIGNQGILLAFTAGGAFTVAQSMGIIPKMGVTSAAPPAMQAPAPVIAPTTPTPAPTDVTTPPATPAPATSTAPVTPVAPPPAPPTTNVDTTPATNAATTTPDAPK